MRDPRLRIDGRNGSRAARIPDAQAPGPVVGDEQPRIGGEARGLDWRVVRASEPARCAGA